jgi:shikimate dehydrogenase
VTSEPRYRAALSGEKPLTYGLLGEHLGHSHSPAIHAALGSTPYDLVAVPPAEVEGFLAARPFAGLNVTIPYKKVAAAACDELSPAAARLGNANTLAVRADGTLYGDNTDYHGFARELASCGVDCAGRVALVLGDGGAAATVRAVLADAGCAEVLTATRRGGEGRLSFAELAGEAGAAVRARVGVLVNATPVGMFPHADDPLLVDPADFPQLAAVCDLVYNPLATRLVQRARELGIPAAGGLLMLVAQARRSSDLFLGVERGQDVEDRVHAELAGRLTCVSLIGMPGSGKTATGRALAELLGFEFVDVDELVVQAAGMPVAQIFAERGEEGFRALETRCTAEACARGGRVVATGGGVVTQPRNLFYLRQNGPVVLLERGLEPDDGADLSLAGRPLSQARGVAALRAERAPLYRAWADLAVAAGADDARGVAVRTAAALGLPTV